MAYSFRNPATGTALRLSWLGTAWDSTPFCHLILVWSNTFDLQCCMLKCCGLLRTQLVSVCGEDVKAERGTDTEVLCHRESALGASRLVLCCLFGLVVPLLPKLWMILRGITLTFVVSAHTSFDAGHYECSHVEWYCCTR